VDYRAEVVTLAEKGVRVLQQVPPETLDWLLDGEIPQVSVLARRELLGKSDDAATGALWARRNEYAPVAAILDAQREDGSWDIPSRDYQKYRGSLWQLHLLGELYANGDDERVQRGVDYAFSRQMDDGSWSASNKRAAGSIPCLTANVGRALARLGYARDERIAAALKNCADLRAELGFIDCRQGLGYQLNGYCHMLAPKLLLFLAEVPRERWPDGAEAMRDECVERLRDKQVFRCLPSEYTAFGDLLWSAPSSKRAGLRDAFLAENPVLHYGPKPGWLRFSYPLSYNSDVLESLRALAAVGEGRRPEYEDAIAVVENAADANGRWALKNTHNGKMYGDVEAKGKPSKWLTLQALGVLEHFSADSGSAEAG
jgi:hypothetical protein